jgi:hypothetical protein
MPSFPAFSQALVRGLAGLADLGYGVLDSAMVETAVYCLVECS